MSEAGLLIQGTHISLQGCIGQGEFGIVYRASLNGYKGSDCTLTAAKTLKKACGSDVNNLIVESLKMSKFHHRNVMELLGVCIDIGESPFIVMPYMIHGSLLSYLRKYRAELTICNEDNDELVSSTRQQLLSMCLQIAKGMEYLASQHFVHRDLAARNCMIDENYIIKVSDFGLSEDIYARDYFRQQKEGTDGKAPVKVPIKWMAVESLNDGMFSEKTDVWSFGVTCWEVFSLGKNPYPLLSPFALIKYLETGERLEKPLNAACSKEIYNNVMNNCWLEQPERRPTFLELVTVISTALVGMVDYLDLNSLALSSRGSDTASALPTTTAQSDPVAHSNSDLS